MSCLSHHRSSFAACLSLLFVIPSSHGADASSIAPAVLSASQLEPRVRAAADWLVKTERPDGSFRYGWEPALDQDLLDESLIRQAGAAVALARCATVLKDEELAQAASLAIDTLLSQTKRIDGRKPTRRPIAPYQAVHPVGFSALILLAITEHPEPTVAMKTSADELANYLMSRQRDNGSIRLGASDDPADDEDNDADHPGMAYYPGEAVYALSRHAGKSGVTAVEEAVRSSREYYWRHWRREKEPAFIPWQTAAHTEVVARSKDRHSAEFVFEMNDWLLQLQYREGEGKEEWVGGFAAYAEGEKIPLEPGINSASYAESLADAWRTARLMEDRVREARYREALSSAIRFISQLQYDDSSVQHFVPEYRPKLVGAFRAGLRSGTVRIDFTQHASMAMSSIMATESGLSAVTPEAVKTDARVSAVRRLSASEDGRGSAGQGGSRK